MANISTKSARIKLRPQREPYFSRQHKGCYLGFRRGPDTWIARFTIRGADGKYRHQYKALDAHDFDDAKEAAEAWFVTMGSPAARVIRRGTVLDALNCYLTYLREQGRDETANNVDKNHFSVTIYDDAIANLKLEDMTRQDFREWRERLRKGRKNRSVNRQVRAVVAGLNRAMKEGHSGSPNAWTIDPLADDDEAEITLFLTPAQRQSIITAASPACGDFLRAIEFTGGRPGELAAATVADLDTKNGSITLRHRKGRPAKVRPRQVVLADDAANFFRKQVKGKTPAAPLLLDPDRKPWGRHKWADEVQAAIQAVNAKARGKARIPKGASAYSYRHARISELLQSFGVDPVTVAHQTGTSLRMIENHYHRFIAPALREKLRAIGD